jgi:hypothetical protein
MPMSVLRILSASLLLASVFAVACTTAARQMTTLPKEAASPGTPPPPETVVLFRLAVDEGGDVMPAPLSAQLRGRWHFQVDVAADEGALASGRILAAGQLDRASTDSGWGFLTLPAGRYRFAYSALRTKFSMTGAHDTILGHGRSTPYRLDVPSGAALLYIGTFALSCHRIDRWLGYVEHECTRLEVRGEEQQARELAATSLRGYGPIKVDLAAVAPALAR